MQPITSPATGRPRTRRSRQPLIISIVTLVLLCPLACLSSPFLLMPCDLQTKWYRIVDDKYPILPMPAGTMRIDNRKPSADLRPGYASARVASWYEDVRYVNDQPAQQLITYFQARGDVCRQTTAPYLIGGFTLELQVPYWHCVVAAEPWSDGDVYLMPQAAYANALQAVYDHPSADLPAPIDQTVIRYRLEGIYGRLPPLTTSVPMSTTALLASARWCEPT